MTTKKQNPIQFSQSQSQNQTRTSSFSFHNSKLQEAVADSSKSFDSYLNSLDKISQDIKTLESFIISKGINKDFAGYVLDENPNKSENIEWSHDVSSGKHRLNYAIYECFPASVDENNFLVPGYKELEKKIPLIEAPSNIRLPARSPFCRSSGCRESAPRRSARSDLPGRGGARGDDPVQPSRHARLAAHWIEG